MRDAYYSIERKLAANDYRLVEKRAMDGSDCITFRHCSSRSDVNGLWLAERSGAWYLCVGGVFGDFFEVDAEQDIAEICLALLREMKNDELQAPVSAAILNRFRLSPVVLKDWVRQLETKKFGQWQKRGWSILEEDEMKNLMSKFHATFQFSPDTEAAGWPSIVEPTPSLTWDVSEAIGEFNRNSDEFERIERTLRKDLVEAIGTTSDLAYVLDPHHQCYQLHFGKLNSSDKPYDWPVTLLPFGSYRIFVTEQFQSGIFGHPWEKTICVFGDEVMNKFIKEPECVFWPLIRKNGHPVN